MWLASYGKDPIIGAEEDPASGDRRGGDEATGQLVLRENLHLTSGLQHQRVAGLTDEIDLSVSRYRRRHVDARNALPPDALSGGSVHGADDPLIGRHVDQAVVVNDRRDVWPRRRLSPHDVG